MRPSNGLFMVGVGAALMYFFDPQNGRQRRVLAQDRYAFALRKLQESTDAVRDVAERTGGIERAELVERSGRTLAGALGGGLAALGMLRGGIRGLALGALGSTLIAGCSARRAAGIQRGIECGPANASKDLETGVPGDTEIGTLGYDPQPHGEALATPPGVQRH